MICYDTRERGSICPYGHFVCISCSELDGFFDDDGDVKCRLCTHKMDKVEPVVEYVKPPVVDTTDTMKFYLHHITERILNRYCPNCFKVYYDFAGCTNLKCYRCDTQFCALCLEQTLSNGVYTGHRRVCKFSGGSLQSTYLDENIITVLVEKHVAHTLENYLNNSVLPWNKAPLVEAVGPLLKGRFAVKRTKRWWIFTHYKVNSPFFIRS